MAINTMIQAVRESSNRWAVCHLHGHRRATVQWYTDGYGHVYERSHVEFIDSHCGAPVRVRGVVRNRLVYLYGVEFLIDPVGNKLLA
jgi:hypothetical protein